MTRSFADAALEAVERKRSVVVVGLDPALERLPMVLQPKDWAAPAAAEAIAEFCAGITGAVADIAVAVKPQIAFFERWGPSGLRALERAARFAKEKGLLVLLDAKRGDIGSTAEAYAAAYLDESGLGGVIDAITVNPYLGADATEPFVRRARDKGKGVFVLVRTSNPSAGELQDRRLEGGQPVYEEVARLVCEWGRSAVGASGYSNVGAVVGATAPEQLRRVREILPSHWLLLPGYGAQGAGPADVVAGLDAKGGGVLVNASRSIIYAWQERRPEDAQGSEYAQAAREAAEEMRQAINAAAGEQRR